MGYQHAIRNYGYALLKTKTGCLLPCQRTAYDFKEIYDLPAGRRKGGKNMIAKLIVNFWWGDIRLASS